MNTNINKIEDSKTNKQKVFLEKIPAKLIHDTKKNGLKYISIPDADSDTGYGRIYGPFRQIRPLYKKSGEPIPGLINIYLGAPDEEVDYRILTQDGKYEKKRTKASEIVAIWEANKGRYYAEGEKRQYEPVESTDAGTNDENDVCEYTYSISLTQYASPKLVTEENSKDKGCEME